MKAKELYDRLEKDFILPGITDEWYTYMTDLEPFICDNFKKRSMGLMCDFTDKIEKVYTAVFPSEKVLKTVLDNAENAMIFLHHASDWDLKKSPVGFFLMNNNLLELLREKHISLYCLHSPLDNFSEYSTSKTLADALEIEIIKPFVDYYGTLAGVIGKTKHNTIGELHKQYSQALGHETKLYQYGDTEISGNKVAVCAGGGNQTFVVQEMIKNNVQTLLTGITLKSEIADETHELEKANHINVIGGTHYSNEKFACMAMCGYFSKLGLYSEFIPGEPCFADM